MKRALVLAVAALSAFASAKVVNISDQNNGSQVNVNVGDVLRVSLSGNAGTGYSWAVAQNNNDLLQPMSGRTATGNPQPGGSNRQIFRFTAQNAGGEALAFNYRRPWRGGGTAKTFRVLVVVHQGDTPKTVVLRDSDNGTKLRLNWGDILEVRLSANPSTGYGWKIRNNDANILEPLSDDSRSRDNGMMGAPGLQVYRFQANRRATDNLRLVYRRPNDKSTQYRTWSATVVVK